MTHPSAPFGRPARLSSLLVLLVTFAVLCALVSAQTPGIDRMAKHDADRAAVELDGQTFDFIIIGAGSAGSVLTKRLSENPAVRVLTLEAGPSDSLVEFKIPAAMSGFMSNMDDPSTVPNPFNWNYMTEPDEGLAGRRSYVPRGKVLGGSSTINAMIYNRGHQQDYDNWCLAGNRGWCWNDVLPYFVRSERSLRFPDLCNRAHGHCGEWVSASPTYSHPIMHDLVDAIAAEGHGYDNDHADGDLQGANLNQVNIFRGERMQLADAMLTPDVLDRPNLHVRTLAHVTKILFRGLRATGVTFHDIRTGQTKTVHASKEVVLAAGAIASPQLLMLSGIGDRHELRQHGIRVINHLPGVGKHLLDHPMVGVTVMLKPNSTARTLEWVDDPDNYQAALVEWLTTRTGPMASNVGEVSAFVRTPLSEDGLADMVIEAAPVAFINHGFDKCPSGERCVTVGAVAMRAHSEGYVKLKSADPFDHPEIHHRYFSDPRDMPRLLAGLKMARQITQGNSTFASHLGEEYIPGADKQTDAELMHYIRQYTISGYHQAGTCKMGPRHDRMAVVDDKLQVHRMQNLRVIDASIMPDNVHANINAPTVMIAEKGAKMILDKYNLHKRCNN